MEFASQISVIGQNWRLKNCGHTLISVPLLVLLLLLFYPLLMLWYIFFSLLLLLLLLSLLFCSLLLLLLLLPQMELTSLHAVVTKYNCTVDLIYKTQ